MEIIQLQKEGKQLAKPSEDQLFKNLYCAFKMLAFVETRYQHPL